METFDSREDLLSLRRYRQTSTTTITAMTTTTRTPTVTPTMTGIDTGTDAEAKITRHDSQVLT